MKKQDEIELFKQIDKKKDYETISIPEVLGKIRGDVSRTWFILGKWSDRGYINYGTSLNYPWKEEKWRELREIIKKEQKKKTILGRIVNVIKLNIKHRV